MKLPVLAVTLLFLAAAFIGIFGHIGTTPVDVSPIAPTRIDKSNPLDDDWSITAPDTILGNAEISATLARPVFSRDRRRFIAPPQPEPRSEPVKTTEARNTDASELVLLGVSLGGGRSRALLASRGSTGEWVQPGDTIESWTVDEIRPNEVRLSKSGQKAELQLYRQSGE